MTNLTPAGCALRYSPDPQSPIGRRVDLVSQERARAENPYLPDIGEGTIDEYYTPVPMYDPIPSRIVSDDNVFYRLVEGDEQERARNGRLVTLCAQYAAELDRHRLTFGEKQFAAIRAMYIWALKLNPDNTPPEWASVLHVVRELLEKRRQGID